MNQSADKVAAVIRVGKACDIDTVGFLTGTVTTGDTMKIALQDVNATNGEPDGTDDQSGTVVVADMDDDTWKEVTLGATRTVAIGDLVAIVMTFNSYVAGNFDVHFPDGTNRVGLMTQNYYLFDDNAAGYTKDIDAHPGFSFECNDATFGFLGDVVPASAIRFQSWDNADTPDEYAQVVRYPFPTRACGIWAAIDADANLDLVLYEGTTAKATVSVDSDIRASTAGTHGIWPIAEVTLAKDTDYYVAVKPTTTTNVNTVAVDVNAAAMLAQFRPSADFHSATRTDAGAWSDDTDTSIMAGVVLCGFDDAAGGGASGVMGE